MGLSNAFTLDTNAFAFLFLLVPFSLSGEALLVPTAVTSDCVDERLDSGRQLAFILCLLLSSASRQSEKLCKYFICLEASALFFSVVQAFRRMLGTLALALLFDEGLSVPFCS